MTTDDDIMELRARAKGDQVCAMLRGILPKIERVALCDPDTWSPDDKDLARCVLMAMRGLLLEGRI